MEEVIELKRNNGEIIAIGSKNRNGESLTIQEMICLNADYLYNVYLKDVDLTGCNLIEVDFTKAVLKNVNFSNALLNKASFNSADLQDVNFSNANLTDADFRKCWLENINFSEANTNNASFFGAHLKQNIKANDSAELLSKILFEEANNDVKKQMFAGLLLMYKNIDINNTMTWKRFLNKVSGQNDLKKWAIETLEKYLI